MKREIVESMSYEGKNKAYLDIRCQDMLSATDSVALSLITSQTMCI